MTPHKGLQGYKIERVKSLLARSDMTIAEMAAACGFADQSHLTRAFTQALGLAPAASRRQCSSQLVRTGPHCLGSNSQAPVSQRDQGRLV